MGGAKIPPTPPAPPCLAVIHIVNQNNMTKIFGETNFVKKYYGVAKILRWRGRGGLMVCFNYPTSVLLTKK